VEEEGVNNGFFEEIDAARPLGTSLPVLGHPLRARGSQEIAAARIQQFRVPARNLVE